MSLPSLKKATRVSLRAIGLDEKWLQDQINEDPTLLGLGDLRVIQREKPQASGGRLDFLMHDDDADIRYEIELMLGSLDASHIIRTIEYWDIERQRYPTVQHRAVIVAEEITARFFNVIRLMNRAVPMIALQLSALEIDAAVVLHATKVLDVWEEIGGADDEEPVERADRSYWVQRANSESLAVADEVIELLKSLGRMPKVTYNRGHIAVGTTGQNFCWFHPRKQIPRCHVTLRVGSENRDAATYKLNAAGIGSTLKGKHRVKVVVGLGEVKNHLGVFSDLLRTSDERSKTKGTLEPDDD